MKTLFPSPKLLFFSRLSLYFISALILIFSLSGLTASFSILTDMVFEDVDINVKLFHAQSELARLIISCLMFGILLLIRPPLNKKDHAFNTTCHWYGVVFLYSAALLACLVFLIHTNPSPFPMFEISLRSRAHYWPIVNIFYSAVCISFVYRSLQD